MVFWFIRIGFITLDTNPISAIFVKIFINESGLKCHMKTHFEEKTYQCGQCTKFFSKQCDFKMHMHSHTETKSISYIQSNEKYSRYSDLKILLGKNHISAFTVVNLSLMKLIFVSSKNKPLCHGIPSQLSVDTLGKSYCIYYCHTGHRALPKSGYQICY